MPQEKLCFNKPKCCCSQDPKSLRTGLHAPTYDYEMTFKLVFPEHAKTWMETAQKLPDEVVDKSPYIIGTPDDATEKIDEYVKAGCRHFVINFQVSTSELKETSKLFAEKVMRTSDTDTETCPFFPVVSFLDLRSGLGHSSEIQ